MQHQFRLQQIHHRRVVCQQADMHATCPQLERGACCQQRRAYHACSATDHDNRAEHPLMAIARAYGEIHETREHQHRLSLLGWFFHTLPQTFRRHLGAFWLSLAITIAGVIFGAFAVAFDPDAKSVILPEMFAGHRADPSERVAREERNLKSHSAGLMTSFSAQLMTNNIRVSILALALGMSFGVGTIIVLFYNGIILGLIAVDYVMAGQTTFLLGWLLPHGVIEIPAILIGGQAGLMLAGALIGWGQRLSITERLRWIARDLVMLIFGVVLMLIWAGIVEAFLSQYHEPVIPYSIKIGFGLVELLLLVWFLSRSGARVCLSKRMGTGLRAEQ